jgi:hypothetical protein|tara:strand:- start:1232 stop:2062 length:831 start_codon:yes stop_codon:yes gene_type:complete
MDFKDIADKVANSILGGNLGKKKDFIDTIDFASFPKVDLIRLGEGEQNKPVAERIQDKILGGGKKENGVTVLPDLIISRSEMETPEAQYAQIKVLNPKQGKNNIFGTLEEINRNAQLASEGYTNALINKPEKNVRLLIPVLLGHGNTEAPSFRLDEKQRDAAGNPIPGRADGPLGFDFHSKYFDMFLDARGKDRSYEEYANYIYDILFGNQMEKIVGKPILNRNDKKAIVDAIETGDLEKISDAMFKGFFAPADQSEEKRQERYEDTLMFKKQLPF